MEESSFVIQIEEMLENSKLIKTEKFEIPEFVQKKKFDSVRDILNRFYD